MREIFAEFFSSLLLQQIIISHNELSDGGILLGTKFLQKNKNCYSKSMQNCVKFNIMRNVIMEATFEVYLALGRLGTEAEARPWAGPLCWAALGVLLSLLLASSAWLVVSDLSKYSTMYMLYMLYMLRDSWSKGIEIIQMDHEESQVSDNSIL